MKRFYTNLLLGAIMLVCAQIPVSAQVNDSYFDFGTEGPVGAEETVDNGGNALEVGFKFQVTHMGVINGIHYYSNASNTGTHVANLWDNGGTNLGTADDGGNNGVGWRYIEFASPVAVSVGTTYVASVFMPTGFYSATNNWFNGVPPTDRHDIHLLTDAAAAPPGNGVYIQNATSAFPNASFQASNYWVDIDFSLTFPLPVTLVDFKAAVSGSNVQLSWKTEIETSNKGFEIQRSNNSADWYPVRFTNSLGDGISIRNYSFTDFSLAPGMYYYRLKQIDIDGKSTYSPIVTASISGKGKTLLFQNYPNPFSATSSIRFDLPSAQKIKLSLIDLTGREVRVLANKVAEAGSHQLTINAAALPKQIYVLRLQTEAGLLTRRIVVQ